MKNKTSDVLYCGVSEDKIKNANPVLNDVNFGLLKNWIVERYKIHLRKDVLKEDFPWTDDVVLLNYRFCNVRREYDRESRWLVENVCENGNLSYEDKLLNCILFRLINKSKSVEIFGPLCFSDLDYDLILEKLGKFEMLNSDYVYFSNAFFMSGPKVVCNKKFGRGGSMVLKMIKLVELYFREGIIDMVNNCESQLDVYNVLRKFDGFGEFLAYQIFVDFSYIHEFPFSENEFVVAGPGCKKGLNLIFDDFDGLNFEEALFWIRDNQSVLFGEDFGELFSDLEDYDRNLNVMSLENCMCEISKYIRAVNGTGRPRVRYKII